MAIIFYIEMDTFGVMGNTGIVIVLFLVLGQLSAQITCVREDRLLFHSKLKVLKRLQCTSTNDDIIEVGKTFLGTPYVGNTLEIGKKETLVVNLRGMDCTTFVENVLAFTMLLRDGNDSFDSFGDNLRTIRYRNGFLDGYSSRLHYFTDWIRNNNEKGVVREITAVLGGVEIKKTIDFMGRHRNLYPFLEDDTNYKKMRKVERGLAGEKLCILPQNIMASVEGNLKNGDIIALATSIEGLDVAHTGFAVRMHNGRIHLLHASLSGEVTITKEPLVDYLKMAGNTIGIIVARPIIH